MKLIHPDIARQIDFKNQFCYSLIIENSQEFFSKTNELYSQSNGGEGNFVLSHENQELNIAKSCLFIFDFYNDLLNSKKTITSINNKVSDILKQDDYIEDFAQLNSLIAKINAKVTEQLDYDVSYNENLEFSDFSKLSNYKILRSDNLLENILTYVQINCQNQNISFTIFVNLFSYLSQEEIEKLIKQLHYMQINILFIDSQQKYHLKDCETIIIDNDLCVI